MKTGHRVRAFATDFDGTLAHDGTVPEKALSGLVRLKAAGVIPLEVGALRHSKKEGFADCLSKAARDAIGHKIWEKRVWRAVGLLRDCFWPDEVVIGGGNAKTLIQMPQGCRRCELVVDLTSNSGITAFRY